MVQYKVIFYYLFILIVSCVLSIFYGSVDFANLNFLYFSNNEVFYKIIILRLKGLLHAIFVGSILSLSGYVLQKILRNPLADPFILGISSGGVCFASIFIVFNSATIYLNFPIFFIFSAQSIFAFLGCFLSFLILLIMRKKVKIDNDEYIYPVIGVVINTFFSSILMMIFTVAKPERMSEIHNFLIGTLQPISFNQLFFLVIISIYPLINILKNSKYFDGMLFGDDFSKSLGIDAEKIRNKSILMICILISVVVSTSGVIAFIGLIIPHIVRKIHRFETHFECVFCMLFGAIILVNADTLSRTLFSPSHLSVGIFTALIGAPMLSFIILKRKII